MKNLAKVLFVALILAVMNLTVACGKDEKFYSVGNVPSEPAAPSAEAPKASSTPSSSTSSGNSNSEATEPTAIVVTDNGNGSTVVITPAPTSSPEPTVTPSPTVSPEPTVTPSPTPAPEAPKHCVDGKGKDASKKGCK